MGRSAERPLRCIPRHFNVITRSATTQFLANTQPLTAYHIIPLCSQTSNLHLRRGRAASLLVSPAGPWLFFVASLPSLTSVPTTPLPLPPPLYHHLDNVAQIHRSAGADKQDVCLRIESGAQGVTGKRWERCARRPQGDVMRACRARGCCVSKSCSPNLLFTESTSVAALRLLWPTPPSTAADRPPAFEAITITSPAVA